MTPEDDGLVPPLIAPSSTKVVQAESEWGSRVSPTSDQSLCGSQGWVEGQEEVLVLLLGEMTSPSLSLPPSEVSLAQPTTTTGYGKPLVTAG